MARTVLPDVGALHGLAGKELGPSEWLEITQERIDAFAAATGDRQWIHVDAERARRESPFGTTIAHGHLTLALAPVLLDDILHVENVRFVVNPGVQRMRFRAPVRCGDRLRMRITVGSVRGLPGGGVHATIHLVFEVEGEKRPAAFGDAMVVYYP
jgi:acyl dehydratase